MKNDYFTELMKHLTVSDLLIVADLDETLLNSRHSLSEENREAIRKFILAGGHFAVASGRTEPPVKLLDIPTNVPSILYNGSALYDLNTDSFLWCEPMDSRAEDLANGLLERFPGLGLEVITQKGTYVVSRNKESDIHIGLEHLHPLETGISPALIREPWMKIMIDWEEAKLRDILAWMDSERAKGRIHFNYSFSNSFIVEIMSPKADKGIALKKLSSLLGIPLSNVIAIGDNLNDLQIMHTAGIRVAPSNARKEILDLADYISVDHDDHVMQDLVNCLLD